MDEAYLHAFWAPFENVQHLRDWCLTYLGVDFPSGHVDPESNSSPAEWMFEAYQIYRNNKLPHGQKQGFIVLSARDAYKTLSESALAVILLCHFKANVAHMAAIVDQARKAIDYINTFLNKILPILEHFGYKLSRQSRREIELLSPDGQKNYIKVIVSTLQGTNSEHVTVLSIDEVDVMRFPKAYEEAKLIPSYYAAQQQFPIIIKASTRKFAFGLMEKELENAVKIKEKIFRWNIIDITEACPPSRHLPNEPKVTRFIGKDFPLQNLSQQEFDLLPSSEKAKFSPIEAYAGCAKCPLLPVCQTRLAHRPQEESGGLYKPIQYTIDLLQSVEPDTAAAQLMCWRPLQQGVVYARFVDNPFIKESNTITLEQAWEKFMGSQPVGNATLERLVHEMHQRDIPFVAGVDWGHVHAFAIVVTALMPDGEWWFFDCIARPGLEFEQMILLAEEVRDFYKIKKWYVDQASPMFIKAFNARSMPCPPFKKDVKGGVESVRRQIVDGYNRRRLKVIKTPKTEFLLEVFKKHSFKLDQAGEPTDVPSDDTFADVADAIRYMAQNLFPVSAAAINPPPPTPTVPTPSSEQEVLNKIFTQLKDESIAQANLQNDLDVLGQPPVTDERTLAQLLLGGLANWTDPTKK